jgi:hypothetical protein
VIQEREMEERRGLPHALGDLTVVRGRLDRSGRMIVADYEGSGSNQSTVVLPTPPVETRSRQITPFVALRQRTTRDSRTSEAR